MFGQKDSAMLRKNSDFPAQIARLHKYTVFSVSITCINQ